MRTEVARNIRMARYDAAVSVALPHITSARGAGAKCAEQFALHLTEQVVPAPTNQQWTVWAVLRALRRAKFLGLDKGSLPASACKVRLGRGRPGGHSTRFLKLATG